MYQKISILSRRLKVLNKEDLKMDFEKDITKIIMEDMDLEIIGKRFLSEYLGKTITILNEVNLLKVCSLLSEITNIRKGELNFQVFYLPRDCYNEDRYNFDGYILKVSLLKELSEHKYYTLYDFWATDNFVDVENEQLKAYCLPIYFFKEFFDFYKNFYQYKKQ